VDKEGDEDSAEEEEEGNKRLRVTQLVSGQE
jgi:hypothetical protein